ncbi:MAG: mechanosensitive ion channel [Xanthomonadales bacterium]|nr:mechanosensitive ion channel [Xanthomonadales bacterium]
MDKVKEFFSNLVQHQAFLETAILVVGSLAFLVIGHFVAKFIAWLVAKMLHRRSAADLLIDFISKVVYVMVFSIPLMAALELAGLNVTSVMAILGALGLAIGLALKDSLSNFAAGVIISVLGPFRTGDFVEVADLSGTVTDVSLFSTILTTTDNKLVTIPNNSIINNPITNFTAKNTRRIDMTIGVSYDDDLKVARDILTRVVNANPRVLKDPAPAVVLMDLADSSINFACRPWVNKEDYWGVRDELLETFKSELEAAGCSFPYPQQDVHMHTVSSG